MLRPYIPILLFVLVSIGVAIAALLVSRLLHPRRPNPVKLEPYECGIAPETDARDRYSIRYYLIAMLFVIFEVETVFGLIEMLLFLLILIVGYVYAWRKGALEWQT
jgi:NADH-quinone oxidoreductase subunit A